MPEVAWMTRAKKKTPGKKEAPRDVLTPELVIQKRLRHLANREEVSSFFGRLVVIVIVVLVLFGFIFGLTSMKNDDMSPRISAGDLMLYYRLERNLNIQDVIVFQKDGKQYTGRIIAQNGDSVEITNQAQLVINGSPVLENEIYYSTPKYESQVQYPVTLTEDQYFILCDYREGAKDSRYFGPVEKNEIKGKVITVLRRSGL